jgi:hypothetical protein
VRHTARPRRAWDLDAGGPPLRLQTPGRGTVLRVAFTPDGDLAGASFHTGEVVVWDAETGALLGKGESLAVRPYCIAALPSGRLLTADSDGVARLWTPRTP